MGVSLKCPKCRAKLTVPDKVAGRSVVCPLCSANLKVEVGTNDVYRFAQDDSSPASAHPSAAPAERPSKPTVVKVVVKNAPLPVKEEPSWLVKHVVELVMAVVGGVVTAALLAFFGLSQGDNKGEAKADKPNETKMEKLAHQQSVKQPVHIISAFWGVGNRQANVTDKVARLLADGKAVVVDMPVLGADPAPNVPKRLLLKVQIGDKARSLEVGDRGTIQVVDGEIRVTPGN